MSKLVENEQAKLTATYLNGIAIALIVVGAFAPLTAIATSVPTAAGVLQLGVVVASCVLGSAGLHYVARKILKRMQE